MVLGGGTRREGGLPLRDRGVARQRGDLGRLLVAVGITLYGYAFGMVAIMVLVLEVTGSPAAAAACMVVRTAPRALCSRPGGSLADRFAPARLAALCCLAQAGATALVIAAGMAHQTWLIYLAIGCIGVAAGVFQPATMALMPGVAGPARLARANTAYNGILASAVLGPPALSVPLLALGGPNLPLGVDLGGFLVAAALLASLPRRGRPHLSVAPGAATAAPAGLVRLILGDRFLRCLAVAWAAEGLVAGAAQGAFIAAAGERFGGDAQVGILYAAVGGGSLLGTAVLLRLHPTRVPSLAVVGAALISVVAIGLFALAPGVWLGVACLAVAGMGTSLYQTWSTTQLQRDVEPALLGRASGLVVSVGLWGFIAGSLLVTVLIPLVGWTAGLAVASVLASGLILGLATPRRGDVVALRQLVA